jgi:integrase
MWDKMWDEMNGGRVKPLGKHKHQALTAATVRAVNEPGKYGDGGGLYLKVEASGAKRWVQRVVVHGRRRDLGLGSLSMISLAEARALAYENRKLARAGEDPVALRAIKDQVLTFSVAAHKVYEFNRPSWKNEKHAKQWITTLQRYAFPKIGEKPVSRVTSADLLSVLTPIWQDKPETARRVRQRISMVLEWAIAKGWREDNPAEAVSRALPRHDSSLKKRMKALPYTEVSDAIQRVQKSDALRSTKLAFEFLILTAARSGEVRLADWSEIDKEESVWTVPGTRMKAKKEHRVPLAGRVQEILSEAAEAFGMDGLIFPSLNPHKPLSDMTLSKLMKDLELDGVPHGFRSAFRVWAEEQTGFPPRVAEAALAHQVRDKTEAAYNRTDLFERRRELMAAWERYLCPKQAGVVQLTRMRNE